jgi:hypothetical protein
MHDYQPPKAHHCFISKEHFHHLASIIKVPPAPQPELTYGELEFTEQDRANIAELISTMAKNNEFQLIFKQGHLKNIGAQINHVHPLKFLSSIAVNPDLKPLIGPMSDDYFKWNKLINGLGAGLTREAIKGKLDLYLADFSAEVGIPAEEIRPYFESRDWPNFVLFLMK